VTRKLPNGWTLEKLEDVVDILDNKRVPINSKERETRPGPIPYYGATGQVGWIDDFLFDEELVLLGEDGAPFFDSAKQKAYVIRGKSWVNNHAHVLRAKNGIPNAYIKYYLDIVDYHGFVTGTTRHKLNQAAMRQIPIPVAPPEQQKRIVAEIEKQFSRLDEAVANLKRVKANLKRYKAAVLKAAVEGRLVETEAERARVEAASRRLNSNQRQDAAATYETGAQLLQRILETRRSQWQGKGKYKEPAAPDTTDLPELPEGWVWATVGQLGTIKGGKRLPAGHAYAEERTPYPYIRVTDFESYGVRTSELQYLKEETQKQIARYTVSSNDIYISIAGSIGLVGQVPVQLSGANLTENAAKITELAHVAPMYLVYWLSSSRGISHISDSTIATTQAKLALFRIEQIPVPLPPLSEQDRIANEVDRRLTLIVENEAQVNANLQRAERLRQSILGSGFAGTLDVRELSWAASA
jgi:type I restriction enzyme S subunit